LDVSVLILVVTTGTFLLKLISVVIQLIELKNK
jgi:hypothetical protein